MSVRMTGASTARAAEPFQPLLLEAPKEWFAEEGAPLREEMRGRMCAPPIYPMLPLLLDGLHCVHSSHALPVAYLDAAQRSRHVHCSQRSLEDPLLTSSLS